MAVLKCKMCGGELDIKEGSCVAECLYCGTKQTIPKLDSEKKATLFARANRLRFNCEFDKASGLYESIVAEFPEEAEAFWGLVLCKYGIEYVDDPATAKKIPTCHRTSFESVMEDTDFEQTLENADPAARAVYRDEAKKIEELRQSIVEISGREEPYDIFICYKETDLNGERTIDSVIAQDVYTVLTDKGYRVFFSRISLEDKLGKEYEPYIFAALNSAKIMLAFGTDYEYFNAVWVKNEWSRYLKLMATDRTKTLIPCYKNIDAYDMPKEFLRLQSQDMGKVGAMQDLLRGVEKILPKKPEVIKEVKETKEVKTIEKVVEKVVVNGAEGGADTGSLLRRAEMFLEDGNFDSANTYAEKVLDILPECAGAYLVKLCCDYEVKNKSGLANLTKPFTENGNYLKAFRFAGDNLKHELNGYIARIGKRVKEAEQEKYRELEEKRTKYGAVGKMIGAGCDFLVQLKSDGSVKASGNNDMGQCDVSSWRNIVAVSAGGCHTVGLKLDGTVVAVGGNNCKQCDVSAWRDIVAISAGWDNTVGLKSDGTVVAVGYNYNGKCNVSDWRDIVAISAGGNHTVGLKNDGTAVAVGKDEFGQCNISDWRDIVAISAGDNYTVGLKRDGTVVAVGQYSGKELMANWRDIVAISAGGWHTVGLSAGGRDLSTKYTLSWSGSISDSQWDNLVGVFMGHQFRGVQFMAGVKSDGAVVVDKNEIERRDNRIFSYKIYPDKLFNSIDTLETELKQAEDLYKRELNEKVAVLSKEKAQLEQELSTLKGLFANQRKKKIEAKIAQIDEMLKNLSK